MHHLFIINPVAGGNADYSATAAYIRSVMETRSDDYEIYVTKAQYDGENKIKAAAAEHDFVRVYAIGGDGTLNEAVNGAAGLSNTAITIVPMGTGNDFIRFFGEDKALFKDVKNLVDGVVHPVDLMEVNGRCGINISSVGLDCQTAAEVHKYTSLPGVGKKFGYILSLGANFIKGIIYNFHVTAGDYHRDGDMVLACVCNGNYYGGGFHPVPEAEIDDGLLDVLVVKKVSRLRFLTAVKLYADGKYARLPDIVDHVQCTGVTITAPKEFTINIDGEMIQDTKMELRLIPGGINFIFPKEVIDNGKIVRKTM